MKLLITILMLITVVSGGLASLYFFRDFNYNLSSLLDIAAYASIVSGIYLMTVQVQKKTVTLNITYYWFRMTDRVRLAERHPDLLFCSANGVL